MNIAKTTIVTCLYVLFIQSELIVASDDVSTTNVQIANNDVSDTASLQRGARNFFNHCAGCHSLKYMRYNQMAEDLDIEENQLIENLMFTQAATQDPITTSMLPSDGDRWFGKSPPDLSLIIRSRSADYVYNFLRGFTIDKYSPTGTDNQVLPGTSMPNILWLVKEQLSHEEFDQFALDIVNFLDYVAEPIQLKRKNIGVWVILFLLIFLIFSYLLYKDIWKEVH
ncbi:MAG TPA: cytochrome c1 [Gammaproteobacteria bacterium]|jgi:ubiquinol-cytochrome c reductase cytochrome c1 subunit|nr:cytochrome c1 [Gammaproteobacteria bacterium]HJP42513.1 cytochrome c1 [Gammaproteobacteria bacterium]